LKTRTSQRAARKGGKAPAVAGGPSCIALLRGINILGNKRVPMAELRKLAEGLGWQQVATYIASGNVLFAGRQTAAAAERALEQAITRRFGFEVSVVVRTAAQWRVLAAGSPFRDAEAERPNALLVGCSKLPPARGAAAALREYAKGGERIAIEGGAVWIDFRSGIARSKVTPAVLDRLVGSPVTMRNWRTVLAIAELLSGSE
jgi:uncharacterized protein (DUF1697 family)